MTNFLLFLIAVLLFVGIYFITRSINALTEVLKNFKTTIKINMGKGDDDLPGDEWKKLL